MNTRRIKNAALGLSTSPADYDLLALAHLRPLCAPFGYIPWTQAAMRPGAIHYILNDIIINNRKVIVDLGSGISTLLIASVIAEKDDTRLISVDENPDWLQHISNFLGKANFSKNFSLLHCPLMPVNLDGETFNYYDLSPLMSALGSDKIDVLSVDGPAAYAKGSETVRYPAVPLLGERLASRYSVFLDDIDRPGEQEISRKWSKILDREGVKMRKKTGLSIWHKGDMFYPGL